MTPPRDSASLTESLDESLDRNFLLRNHPQAGPGPHPRRLGRGQCDTRPQHPQLDIERLSDTRSQSRQFPREWSVPALGSVLIDHGGVGRGVTQACL